MKNSWFKVFKLSTNKSIELEATNIGMGFNIYEHNRVHSRGISFESNVCNLVGGTFDCSWRTDHAGVHADITLFGWTFAVTFYDVRHWDYDKECWESYDEE